MSVPTQTDAEDRLDTSCILAWLIEKGWDVVCYSMVVVEVGG